MGTLRFPNGAEYVSGTPVPTPARNTATAAEGEARIEKSLKAREYRRIAGNTNDIEVKDYYLAKARELEAQL